MSEIIDTRDLVEERDDEDTPEERRAAIVALFEEIEGYAGDRPEDGIALIRDDYFEEYARDFADDIGALTNTSWPHNHIDWKAAADDLRQDYTSVDFDGDSYWYR